MTGKIRAALVCALALLAIGPAAAQNLSLRAPAWASPLLATDIIPTTGGRAALAADGVTTAVRVTIAPLRGGVARVIRFEAHADGSILAVRRFTGHPSTGWWLWGPDTPRVTNATAAQAAEINTLARAAIGVGGTLGGSGDTACASGEQAFIEVFVEGHGTSLSRACIANTDPGGQLALRLSELAGSRDEEELAGAAVSELLAADRAFAAKARADGVPAAFAAYASDNAIMLSRATVTTGHAAVVTRFANWPRGARLEWAPETARVSSRGDMGWTWGNSTQIAADGTRTQGRYISVWTRDDEDGSWKFAFDAGVD